MTKKINTKLNKLIKYYSLINHNLIYNNQAINRYKNNINPFYGPKYQLLSNLRKLIAGIKNCELKKSAKNLCVVFYFLTINMIKKDNKYIIFC